MVGNASGIDLNNATVNQLSRIGGIGPVLAARLVEHRPFRTWADIEEIEGFDRELVNNLRGSGARLGRARLMAKAPRASSRVLREPKPPESEGKRAAARRGGRRTRQSKNIFSGEDQIRE
jgi:hypothetical protein